MTVIEDIALFPKLPCPVVTSGTFDGVHLGHQKILNRLPEMARQCNGQSVVITYWPHPRLVLNPDDTSLKLLSTIEERKALLAGFGVDYLLVIPFSKEFSKLSSSQFIQQILIKAIGTKKLVIGYDHRFGKNREGGFEHLLENAQSYGFTVEEIPRHDVDEIAVSSTKIRQALEQGRVTDATHYLGRYYTLTGEVIKGRQLGRTIGYPTANILPPGPHKLIPAMGVYAVFAEVNGQVHGGMLNIGTNPTVGGTALSVEVYLFDFNKDIYGRQLTLHFVERLRDEEKYASLEEMTQQLVLDEQNARAVLQKALKPNPKPEL